MPVVIFFFMPPIINIYCPVSVVMPEMDLEHASLTLALNAVKFIIICPLVLAVQILHYWRRYIVVVIKNVRVYMPSSVIEMCYHFTVVVISVFKLHAPSNT